MSTTPVPAVAPSTAETAPARPAGRWRRTGDESRLHVETLLEGQQAILDQLTGLELVRNAVENLVVDQRHSVLWSGLAVLDGNGVWDMTVRVSGAAIFVANLSAQPITVANLTRQSGAPTQGTGVHVVPANCAMAMNIRSSAYSIYGTPGAQVDVQILGRPVTPFASAL